MKGKVRGICPAPRERARAPQPGEREEHQEQNQAEQLGAEDPEREGDVWNDGGKLARIRNAEVVKEKCPQRRGNGGTEQYGVRENGEARAADGDTTWDGSE